MKINAINQFKAGEMLYNEGDAPGCLYMVLKGKLCIKGRGYITNCSAGAVIGFEQFAGEAFENMCYTPDGAGVYVLNAENTKNLTALLSSNKDYRGITVYTQSVLLKELYLHYRQLLKEAENTLTETKTVYARYQKLIETSGCKAVMIPDIPLLKPFENPIENEEDIEAQLEYSKIPLDTLKAFYAACENLPTSVLRNIYEQEELLRDASNMACDHLVNTFMLYAGDENNSLFRALLSLGIEMKAAKVATAELEELIGSCFACRDRIKKLITETTGRFWYDNDEEIKALYLSYAEGNDFRSEGEADSAADSQTIIKADSLNDCLHQLFDYAEYPDDKAAAFEQAVDKYAGLEDKDSTDDDTRKLRQVLTVHYYDLYLKTALKYFEGNPADPAVEMFLDFGLLSEKLLTHDQLVELSAIKKDRSVSHCSERAVPRQALFFFLRAVVRPRQS